MDLIIDSAPGCLTLKSAKIRASVLRERIVRLCCWEASSILFLDLRLGWLTIACDERMGLMSR